MVLAQFDENFTSKRTLGLSHSMTYTNTEGVRRRRKVAAVAVAAVAAVAPVAAKVAAVAPVASQVNLTIRARNAKLL